MCVGGGLLYFRQAEFSRGTGLEGEGAQRGPLPRTLVRPLGACAEPGLGISVGLQDSRCGHTQAAPTSRAEHPRHLGRLGGPPAGLSVDAGRGLPACEPQCPLLQGSGVGRRFGGIPALGISALLPKRQNGPRNQVRPRGQLGRPRPGAHRCSAHSQHPGSHEWLVASQTQNKGAAVWELGSAGQEAWPCLDGGLSSLLLGPDAHAGGGGELPLARSCCRAPSPVMLGWVGTLNDPRPSPDLVSRRSASFCFDM